MGPWCKPIYFDVSWLVEDNLYIGFAEIFPAEKILYGKNHTTVNNIQSLKMSTTCDVINLSNVTYRFTVPFREYSRWLQAAVARNTDSCQLIWLTYPVIG